MPGDPALGMPRRLAYRYPKGSGIGSKVCQRAWHRFHNDAQESGIGSG